MHGRSADTQGQQGQSLEVLRLPSCERMSRWPVEVEGGGGLHFQDDRPPALQASLSADSLFPGAANACRSLPRHTPVLISVCISLPRVTARCLRLSSPVLSRDIPPLCSLCATSLPALNRRIRPPKPIPTPQHYSCRPASAGQYDKFGTIQRRLAFPQHMDETSNCSERRPSGRIIFCFSQLEVRIARWW